MFLKTTYLFWFKNNNLVEHTYFVFLHIKRTFFIEKIYFLKSWPFLTSSALHMSIHKTQYLSLNIIKRTFLLNSSKLTILERNTYVQLSFVLQGFKSCWGEKKIGTPNSAWPSRLYQIHYFAQVFKPYRLCITYIFIWQDWDITSTTFQHFI